MPHSNYDHVPVHVDSVHIEGLGRTKDDYIQRFINDLFTAKNFSELAFLASEVGKKLETIGCFNGVNVIIDTSKNADATLSDYEVTYVVNESNRFAGGISTMVGSNEGSIILAARLPNVAGRGERITFEHAFGSNSNKSSHLSFAKPLPQISKTSEASFTLFQNKNSNLQAGYNIFNRGGLLDFYFGSAQHIKHNMQWEGAWRELEAASRLTSFRIREQSGHSFKSSLRHIITVDHRDQPIFPTNGFHLKVTQEYAGLGGDVAFLKNDSDLQVNIPLPFDMVLQGGLRFGVFKPLDVRIPSFNSSDLFFLGGPHTLRGFEMRSLGPRADSDVLGGKSYWTSGIHLFGPLPFRFGKGSFGDYCRTHLFFNAGNIIEQEFDPENITRSLGNLVSDYKAAYGLGLALRLGQLARIEMNYCWPFRFSDSDKYVRGLQLGIGVEFV